MNFKELKVLVRGAGDIASGIIWNLAYAGFKVVCTDVEKPSCIRTEVAFSTAIYEGVKTLGGVSCVYIKDESDVEKVWNDGNVALLIDSEAKILEKRKFDVLVDAILAKRNIGTKIDMADTVIGVGPGFTVNKDCNYAIETMRGHTLSKIYESGSPIPDTGTPGLIAAHGADRVMHSSCEGILHNMHRIGDIVKRDEVLSRIEEIECGKPTGKFVMLTASIDGLLRGILRDGFYVKKGLKVADIDPRLSEYDNCFTISDKARSIGAAAVTTIMHVYSKCG